VIDSTGRPKPAYWYLKRAFAPVGLFAVDEGLNGLWLHAVNDTEDSIDAELHVNLYREGRCHSTGMSTPLTITARNASSIHADALFDGFVDLTYAYRCGPPQHDVVAATLRHRGTGNILAAAHGFPCGLPAMRDEALGLGARAEARAGGYVVTVEAARFAHAVAIDAAGFLPDDNFFHIEPGEPRQVFLRAEIPGRALQGSVTALNGTVPVPILCVVRAEAAC
jgi:beta-mannosidase